MKQTKQGLIDRLARIEREVEPLTLALCDAVNGTVTWFGRGEYKLGISRATGAHGGIVIERVGNSAAAHYWEQWSRDAHAHLTACLTGENTEHNRELLRRRDLIEAANQFVRSSQSVA